MSAAGRNPRLDEAAESEDALDDVTLVRPDLASAGGDGFRQAAPVQEFGEYELLETIAKGGMGVVYKARQRKLNRVVAVKMILAGQLADQVDIDRFYAEAEAAANLRHPNIVAIHEIGEHEGRHFFSMDYIEGRSLADLVRENPLRAELAAGYVQKIAETMQYAHGEGILHRDLKPSNVLIDRAGEPLITDFGLAKRLEGGQSQLTLAGTVLGTPSYMPPEQASGRGDDVDARSDIFSMGAVLYDLLTGRPPFLAANPFETIKQVLESEPVALRALNPSVPRDLETICGKCLQKEPARRYQSAQAVADELGRFLAGEPILARPISRLERAWRWCRRNRLVASLIGTATSLLVVALLAITIGYVQTTAALARSEESFRQARAVVDELFTRVSENTLLNQPGMQQLRKELLAKTLDYYQRFIGERGDDPALRDELALSFFRLGLITQEIDSPGKALPFYEQAIERQRQLVSERPADTGRLAALGNSANAMGVALARLQKIDAALAAYGEAIDLRTRLTREEAGNAEYQRHLASSIMNRGLVEKDRGNYAQAMSSYQQAQAMRRQTLESNPGESLVRRDLAMGYYNLGQLAMTTGDYPAAEEGFGQAAGFFAELAAEDPRDLNNQYRLATCQRLLGDLKFVSNELDLALEYYGEASGRMETLARLNLDVPEYQAVLAGLYKNLGLVEQYRGEFDAAREVFLKARDILRPLAEQAPKLPRYRRDYAVALRDIGSLQAETGEAKAARENLEASLRLLDELVSEFAGNADFEAQMAETRRALEALAPPDDEQPGK